MGLLNHGEEYDEPRGFVAHLGRRDDEESINGKENFSSLHQEMDKLKKENLELSERMRIIEDNQNKGKQNGQY